MSAALYDLVMDNPMAVVPRLDSPVPEAVHECPSCGAVWEKWEDGGRWEHDSGFVRYMEADPIADKCCPICAADDASREVLIGFCEAADIRAEAMGAGLCRDGVGVIDTEAVEPLWRFSKAIAPEESYWEHVREYIAEFHRSKFYDYRRDNGV